jgi:acetoin utilization deacetylase AcuC-like enzyme
MSVTIVFHPRFLEHRQADANHPERPERLQAIIDRLQSEDLWSEPLTPEPAPIVEAIGRIHDARYLDRLRAIDEGPWDFDTFVRPQTFDIARLAAGGAILAAETAWRERRPALALLRPPGHHATPTSAMGFCYFNNIAIAAQAILDAAKPGSERRVAIVDIDVHHGNGTQDAFYHRDDVLFISLHQWPHYPGTGRPDETGIRRGEGHNLNLALPPDSGDATYADAFARVVEPVLRHYAPSMLLVSLGADAHYRDPLANMTLSTPGYLHLVSRLQRLAADLCNGRLTVLLEGGYDLEALADVVAGTAALLSDRPYSPRLTDIDDTANLGKPVIDRLAKRFAQWWPVG